MLPLIGIGLASASLLLNILGLAIPYWTYDSVPRGSFGYIRTKTKYQGLWTICKLDIKGRDISRSCCEIPEEDLDDAYKATRAMEILGMLIIMGALVCVLLKQFVMKDHALLLKIGAICAIVAGVLMIIGTIIFGSMHWIDSSKLHAGFALCIISGITGIAAGSVIFLGSVDSIGGILNTAGQV